ncbi:MAG: hypothetical protein ABIQ44_05110 [Chloroflexia bacterium]
MSAFLSAGGRCPIDSTIFGIGEATALPFLNRSFDAVVMALVIISVRFRRGA